MVGGGLLFFFFLFFPALSIDLTREPFVVSLVRPEWVPSCVRGLVSFFPGEEKVPSAVKIMNIQVWTWNPNDRYIRGHGNNRSQNVFPDATKPSREPTNTRTHRSHSLTLLVKQIRTVLYRVVLWKNPRKIWEKSEKKSKKIAVFVYFKKTTTGDKTRKKKKLSYNNHHYCKTPINPPITQNPSPLLLHAWNIPYMPGTEFADFCKLHCRHGQMWPWLLRTRTTVMICTEITDAFR